MRLEAELLAGAGLKLSTRPLQTERMNNVYRRRLGDEPADRLLLANLAGWTLIEGRAPGRFDELARHAGRAGTPAEVACRVAERALADTRLLHEEGSDSQQFYVATWTIWIGDRLDRAEYWLEQALENARERGSVLGYGLASASQASWFESLGCAYAVCLSENWIGEFSSRETVSMPVVWTSPPLTTG